MSKLLKKIEKDYNSIDTSSDLSRRGLTLSDFADAGKTLDSLMVYNKAITNLSGVAEYFRKLGCKVYLGHIHFTITL